MIGVVARNGKGGVVLLHNEFHVVRGVGPVVWCEVTIPTLTSPAAGAEAAQRVCKYLTDNVLHRRSAWLGVILDVREGPSVFGPITREASAKLLAQAEQGRKPMAVLTIVSRPLHAQYCELAAQHAPRYVLVTDSVEHATDWMTSAR